MFDSITYNPKLNHNPLAFPRKDGGEKLEFPFNFLGIFIKNSWNFMLNFELLKNRSAERTDLTELQLSASVGSLRLNYLCLSVQQANG